eukprot:SAG11_NODE_3479_length_2423_cov_2.950516_1_plen_165_part_00
MRLSSYVRACCPSQQTSLVNRRLIVLRAAPLLKAWIFMVQDMKSWCMKGHCNCKSRRKLFRDGAAPTPVGRWQRSWGRSAVSDAALDDEPGLRGWILSHAKPALSVGTSFVWQTVKNKMPPVLKKLSTYIRIVMLAYGWGEIVLLSQTTVDLNHKKLNTGVDSK